MTNLANPAAPVYSDRAQIKWLQDTITGLIDELESYDDVLRQVADLQYPGPMVSDAHRKLTATQAWIFEIRENPFYDQLS